MYKKSGFIHGLVALSRILIVKAIASALISLLLLFIIIYIASFVADSLVGESDVASDTNMPQWLVYLSSGAIKNDTDLKLMLFGFSALTFCVFISLLLRPDWENWWQEGGFR